MLLPGKKRFYSVPPPPPNFYSVVSETLGVIFDGPLTFPHASIGSMHNWPHLKT
jgi:hypothetical protein